ncbi:MAG: hypothetical protein JWN69_1240 [Alphaproteobacteria bacterium]|nr:hypothetical protein [Alphaproteobacteria bacterium]
MLIGIGALVLATLFAGAALYISFVEHPARLALGDAPALAQWRTSYKRALPIQAALAVIGGVAGLAAWHSLGGWEWLAGAIALLANWPVTLLAIMPTNRRLFEIAADEATGAGAEGRALLRRWGRLHHIRSALGALSVLLFWCGLATL